MAMPGMSAAIGHIEMRTPEVEIVAIGITGIDAEMPHACTPIQRTVEIRGCQIGTVLPVEQDIAQIQIPTLPVQSVHIIDGVDTHQIVEVDFIGSLILVVRQIELIRHLVRQEKGTLACLLVIHGTQLERKGKHQGKGHHLFHSRMF